MVQNSIHSRCFHVWDKLSTTMVCIVACEPLCACQCAEYFRRRVSNVLTSKSDCPIVIRTIGVSDSQMYGILCRTVIAQVKPKASICLCGRVLCQRAQYAHARLVFFGALLLSRLDASHKMNSVLLKDVEYGRDGGDE